MFRTHKHFAGLLRLIVFFFAMTAGEELFSQAPGLYINEVSQGPSGSKEWVELLVVGTPTCYSIPTLDLRGWYIDDNNGNHATGAGTGIAQGCVRFRNDPFWSAIPIGTIIVIYNDADLDPAIPAQDLSMTDGNCRLVIPISNCTLFEKNTSTPSTATAIYPTTGFSTCGSWTNISMANGDDSFQTIDPSGNLFHSVSWGNNTLNDIIYFTGPATGNVARMMNSSNNNISQQSNWVMVPVASENPGVANDAANQAWICSMNNGCTPPAPIALTTTQVNASCTCTGSATVNATGGFTGCGSPYTYSWAPGGGNTATASGLCAGNYTVTVTDIIGCVQTHTVNITASTAFTLSTTQTNVLCNGGSTGSASVTVTGGTGPFTYSWSPSGGSGANATGLSAGTYVVTVTDATLCSGTATVTITQPTPLSATTSQTNVSCNGGNNGSATVNASGGTSPYSYSWSPSGGTGATASSLSAGTYTCTITDANSCTTTQSFTITQPTPLSATTSQTNVSCSGGNNGSATVNGSGGTSPYSYSWSPSGGTNATASSLSAGTYTCTITDANSCTTTQSFTITQPTPLSATT
ncbi:MAG TPA: SprB repeat-containing protein, partial [Bacteroidia bacterium]|nr:SprB repeat-containing protein [Bacteroidia bacterium]